MESLKLSSNHYNPTTINDVFLKRIYNYYYMKGYIPIIVDKCCYILINIFLIIFINFLTNCVNYRKLLKIGYSEYQLINRFLNHDLNETQYSNQILDYI